MGLIFSLRLRVEGKTARDSRAVKEAKQSAGVMLSLEQVQGVGAGDGLSTAGHA